MKWLKQKIQDQATALAGGETGQTYAYGGGGLVLVVVVVLLIILLR